jgi:hypothetical protein
MDKTAYGMGGKEDEFVREDGSPDYGGENPDAGLRNRRGSYTKISKPSRTQNLQ